MSENGLLLTVHTPLHRYIVRRDQLRELRVIASPADIEQPDDRGKPMLCCELGALLDPRDQHQNARRHALIVPARRRSVALLVDRIADLRQETPGMVQPLGPLLAPRLARPWFLGAVLHDDQPVLVLDLRQIVQDVLLGQHQRVS
jgi:chemotaxis signal transduction protein